MKKINLFLIVLLMATVSCFASELTLKDGTVLVGNITEENNETITISITIPKSELATGGIDKSAETYAKPIKKIPVKKGNFEVVQGAAVVAPINTKNLEYAIKNALIDHGYKIINQKPGVITYMLDKRDFDVTLRFCYAEDEYWYEYVDSRNLGADPARNRIHKNYLRWINILEQEIRKYYR